MKERKHVDFVSDCVIDLVSSGVLKHYIGDEYGIKCQRETFLRLIYRDHRLNLLRNGDNGNGHSRLRRRKRFG